MSFYIKFLYNLLIILIFFVGLDVSVRGLLVCEEVGLERIYVCLCFYIDKNKIYNLEIDLLLIKIK